MAIDWNADVGELFKQLLGGKEAATPSLSAPEVSAGQSQITKPKGKMGLTPLWPLLIVGVVGADLFWNYFPKNERLLVQQEKVKKVPSMINAAALLGDHDRQVILQLEESERKVAYLYTLMFAHREIDAIYATIHELARRNNIRVIELKKVGGEVVVDQGAPESQGKGSEGNPKSSFYRFRLRLRSEGEFLDYLRLRESLLQFGKLIHVDQEQVHSARILNQGGEDVKKRAGWVVVEMQLSAYQTDVEPILEP
ncbi:MAG: hypothetical protein HN344_08175 [Gammaproteobacteria bacterium]|nr:hypothetical protein [Gammaproteobacteria bacterium]